MQEILELAISYLKATWSKRWYAIPLAWVICLAGWFHIYNMPNQYQSAGKLYIDTQSLLRPLLQGLAIQTDVNQQIRLMIKTLLTRPNVIKIINTADLDHHIENDRDMDALIKSLQSKIKFRSRGNNLYTISVNHEDPELAQRIVQATVTVFVENTLGEGRDDSDSARKFIDKQIKEYEKRLLKAEERRKIFKQENYEMLSEGKGYFSQMKNAAAKLQQAKLELKEARENKLTLEREIKNLGDGIASGSSTIQTSYDARIDKLQADIDSYLINYTEKHPDVISTQRLLDRLEEYRKKEISDYAEAIKNNGAVSEEIGNNPIYQQLKISLGQANAAVKTLEVRIIEYEQRYEKMKKLVNTVPEIDSKLVALERDYNVTRSQYNKFLQRRESAHVGRSVEQSTDSVQFRIIEQPRIIDKPVGPDRILLSSLVLLGALAAGVGVAFLLSQIKPVFNSVNSIAQITSYPVLGTVSAVSSPTQKSRRIMMIFYFILLLSALLVFYVSLLSWYYFRA